MIENIDKRKAGNVKANLIKAMQQNVDYGITEDSVIWKIQ